MKRIKKKIKQILNFDERINSQVDKELNNDKFIPINKTQKDDVFIAGFPKSGNTWMQNLVTGLILDSISMKITPQLVSEIVPDVHAKKYYKRLFPIMVFKTHDLPIERYKKVIHLVRDGRDAMVSYYKMEVNRDSKYKYTISDMIVKGKGVYPVKWHLHTKSWLDNPYKSEVLLIKYEDLLNDPINTLSKISMFIGLEIKDERLLEIYKANHISILREKVIINGWDYDNKYKNKKSDSFFRNGTSGSYVNELDKELESFFVNESKDELHFFNYI